MPLEEKGKETLKDYFFWNHILFAIAYARQIWIVS
jgi:hypothetical protein